MRPILMPLALWLFLITARAVPCSEWRDPPRPAALVSATAPTTALASMAPSLMRELMARARGIAGRALHLEGARPALALPRPEFRGADERNTYAVTFGVFGAVGEVTLVAAPVAVDPTGAPFVKLRAEGAGEVFGLGRYQRTIDAEFDLHGKASRRWVSTRQSASLVSSETVSDTAERRPGGDSLALQRRKWPSLQTPATTTAAAAKEDQLLGAAGATSDPLGMIWRLRNQPPAAGETVHLQMLDGMALWRVEARTLAADVPVPQTPRRGVLVTGEMRPVFYNGQPDPGRPERHFKLWLAADASRVPLRLEIPLGVADAVLSLKDDSLRAPAPSSPNAAGKGVLVRPR